MRRSYGQRACARCASGGCASCAFGGAQAGPSEVASCTDCPPSSLLYFNLSLTNPASALSNIPASILDTRSTAIIDRPEEWEMSVVRFDISTDQLPTLVVPVPQPFPGVGEFPSLLSVTLVGGSPSVVSEAPVIIPVNSVDTYGFVQDLDAFCDFANAAFATAFAGLPTPPTGTQPPLLFWDSDAQLFRLFVQETPYVVAAAGYGLIHIYVNFPMYRYITSMPAVFVGVGEPNGTDWLLTPGHSTSVFVGATPPYLGAPFILAGYAGPIISMAQQGVAVGSTNGVRSIYITSSLLPINSESVPTTPAQAQNLGYTSNSTPIVSDFLLPDNPADNPVADRTAVQYLPTAEYRMIQMRGREPIKQVDLTWYFTLFDGTAFPIQISPGGFCSAKILLRRSAVSTLRVAASG